MKSRDDWVPRESIVYRSLEIEWRYSSGKLFLVRATKTEILQRVKEKSQSVRKPLPLAINGEFMDFVTSMVDRDLAQTMETDCSGNLQYDEVLVHFYPL